jgi:hypothetical protein
MWRILKGKAAMVRPPFLVHECRVKSSGEFAGYLVVSGDTLHEAVIEKGHLGSVPKVLEDLKVRYLAIHPFHPLFVYLRSTYSTTLTERFAVDGGYMGKILNMKSCLRKYANSIREKWQGAGMPIRNMRLCGFELDFDRGLVQETEEEEDILFADQRTCLWFLLGMLQPDQMAGVKIHSKFRSLELINLATGFHTSAWDAF